MEKRKTALLALSMIFILALAGCSQNNKSTGQAVTIFKSPNCGCCGIYSQYMDKEGYGVETKNVADLDSIKTSFKVPRQLQSCHTTQVGDYFVEGHIPTEAIDKLLSEKPDIAGIAMPGMPSGSPGMPGRKAETWIIYAVDNDGSYEEFMRI